jgi:phosphatidylethanolamine-binding protein (PEBP) family uncharacterized protein
MFIHKLYILNIILFIFIIPLRADIMLDQLINKTHAIQWYMFQVKTNNVTRTYLANNRNSTQPNGIRVWNFTSNKKWKPIHNAKAFDGFNKAGLNFKNISISVDGKQITFGAKNITKNIPLDSFLDELANKTLDILWYYWKTESGYPFLAFNRDTSAGISIYQHVADGKWKPIHNAKAFDGYPKAQSIFTDVSMSSDGREITMNYNKLNIPLITNILPRETLIDTFFIKSSSLSEEDYKNGLSDNISQSPHIDWTNVPAHTKSLGLEMINMDDNKVIWRVMRIPPGDSNTSFLPSNVDPTYKNMVTFENDYDFERKFYIDPATGQVPPGEYLIVVYALSIASAITIQTWRNAILQHANFMVRAN